MGFDVSFHPVDVSFVQQEIIPFVLGNAEFSRQFDDAARVARNRYRANAWGLAASSLHSDRLMPVEPPKKSFLANLFAKGPTPKAEPPPNFEFETDLFIWGRPFFITNQSPSEVSAAIDHYLTADDEGVDRLAREMLERLSPGLSLAVTPNYEGGIPNAERFREAETSRILLFAEAMKAHRAAKQIRLPDGASADPRDLFASDFALSAISFASTRRPGWMGRGYVWPTMLLEEAGLPNDVFESAENLFSPLSEAEPSLKLTFARTIEENYTLGGYVPPESVPAALELFEANVDKLVQPAKNDGWEYDARIAVQKIIEALSDAKSRGFAFLEASEVYSGPLGMMN